MCGTAAFLCPPLSEALAPSGDRAFLGGSRTTTIAPLSGPSRIDGVVFGTPASATAALPKSEMPRLPFSLQSITAANDALSSRDRLQRPDGRGPPTCAAATVRDADDDNDDDDDDQGFDASHASLTAGAHSPAYRSTTRRLLHRSAGQQSVRAPPQ